MPTSSWDKGRSRRESIQLQFSRGVAFCFLPQRLAV
jgi:hypothetical protein